MIVFTNTGGFNLIVAIADVAWYVRSGSALDTEARERGNSVYFHDRVVPMLPEPLSNNWCSLKPGEDRPCIAVHIRIDAEGNKRGHRFSRAIICSAARQTYTDIQAAIDGASDGDTIHAVIRGSGVASDGREASVMNPRVDGQLLALQRLRFPLSQPGTANSLNA